MINIVAYIVLGALSVSGVSAQQVDRLHITLNKFDTARVSALKEHFKARMKKIRLVLLGTATAVVGLGAGYYYKTSKEQAVGDADVKNITNSADSPEQKLLKMKLLASERKARAYSSASGQSKNNNGFLERLLEQPLKMTLWVGLGLTLLASGHQIFRVFSGTMEDALQLLWYGYEYWYASYEEQTSTIVAQLRESFNQARKAASQTTVEQQLLFARQQRRADFSYQVNSHYRLDIVTLYQRLISSLERIVALMLIVLPEENHPLINQHVAVIQAQINATGESLERDLNENTHGTFTQYSNNTFDLYDESADSIGIFLSTYRTYQPK